MSTEEKEKMEKLKSKAAKKVTDPNVNVNAFAAYLRVVLKLEKERKMRVYRKG